MISVHISQQNYFCSHFFHIATYFHPVYFMTTIDRERNSISQSSKLIKTLKLYWTEMDRYKTNVNILDTF